MNNLIDCFVTMVNEEETSANAQALDALSIVKDVTIVEIPLSDLDTLRMISDIIKAPYALFLLSHGSISIGQSALEHMVQAAEENAAGMVYSDYFAIPLDGKRKEMISPDYSKSAPGKEFQLCPAILFRTETLKNSLSGLSENDETDALQRLLRHFVEHENQVHLHEFLYEIVASSQSAAH